MQRKIIIILIMGAVVFTTATVLAGNYNSSLSNKSTTAIINQQVGDILQRYGAGGAEINGVTDALAVGIDEADLRARLIEIGIGEEGVNEVFIKLDELGAAFGFIKPDDQDKTISTSDAGDASQSAQDGAIKDVFPPDNTAISTSDADDAQVGFKEISGIEREPGIIFGEKEKEPQLSTTESTRSKTTEAKVILGGIKTSQAVFQDISTSIIQNLRSATPEERESLIDELRTSRGTFQTEIVSLSLSIRENAKALRENFRSKVAPKLCEAVCVGGRIAVAHGKGLWMINRFLSATARFEHIVGRLESRVDKLEVRGIDVSSVLPLIEEAKNISAGNEAKLEELKEKYESLLIGENPRGIGEEARTIAKELKVEIENLHAKLREIVDEIRRVVETGPPDEK